MRRRIRPQEPTVLRVNSDAWTKAYLQARLVERSGGEKVSAAIRDRYKRKSIQTALSNMYSGVCCYCEVEIRPAGYENIEHLRPKKRFPKRAFDWHNLHLACAACNQKKGSKWFYDAPFLDSAHDPVEEHVGYRAELGVGVFCVPLNGSQRAAKTIQSTNMNDQRHLEKRATFYGPLLKVIMEISADPAHPESIRQRTQLEALKQGPYGGMISFMCRTLLPGEI